MEYILLSLNNALIISSLTVNGTEAQTDHGCPFHTGSHNNENQVLLREDRQGRDRNHRKLKMTTALEPELSNGHDLL